MITKSLLWLHSHRAAFFILAIIFGALLGLCAGLLAYGMTLLIMPDVTETQRKIIIPAFTILGIGIGLYFTLADLWQRGGSISQERKKTKQNRLNS